MQGGFRLARSEEEEEEEEEVRRSRTLPRRGGRGGQRSPPTAGAGERVVTYQATYTLAGPPELRWQEG
jgi:hypothetical protein